MEYSEFGIHVGLDLLLCLQDLCLQPFALLGAAPQGLCPSLSEELWTKRFYSKGKLHKLHSICFFIWYLNVIIMLSSFFPASLRSF